MAKIKIDAEALRANIAALTQQQQSLLDLRSQLENLTSVIHDGWEGAASEAYFQKLQQYLSQAKSMENIVSEYTNYISTATDRFEALDRECAAQIRASF